MSGYGTHKGYGSPSSLDPGYGSPSRGPGYGSPSQGGGSAPGPGYGSGYGSPSGAPSNTTFFMPTRAQIITSEAKEPYYYMGFFPKQAIKTLKPSAVAIGGKETADAIYYTIEIMGIVHGIDLPEDSISVEFTENGEKKKYALATQEIKVAPTENLSSITAENYGRYTGTKEEYNYTLPVLFTYEMLTTIILTVKNSGLRLGKDDKKIIGNDGAVLTATNGIETYKIIVYGNEVSSFI